LIVRKGAKGEPDETERVTLKGANSSIVLGGHGITAVRKEPFEAWLREHRSLPYVRNGSVWIVTDEKSARDVAKERRGERTGFEAIDPLKDKNITPEDARVLAQQRAENPARGRQVDQLDV
jgi:hypothetical protein